MNPQKTPKASSRRSSILKQWKSVDALEPTCSEPTSSNSSPTGERKLKRRVSFAEKKHVKEFCDNVEQGTTVWNSTYEESDSVSVNCTNFDDERRRTFIPNLEVGKENLRTSTVSGIRTDSTLSVSQVTLQSRCEYLESESCNQGLSLTGSNPPRETYENGNQTVVGNTSMEFTSIIPAGLSDVTNKELHSKDENAEITGVVPFSGNYNTFYENLQSRSKFPAGRDAILDKENIYFGNINQEATAKRFPAAREGFDRTMVFLDASMELTEVISKTGVESKHIGRLEDRYEEPQAPINPSYWNALPSDEKRRTSLLEKYNYLEHAAVENELGDCSMELTEVIPARAVITSAETLDSQVPKSTEILSKGRGNGDLELENRSMEFTKAVSGQREEPTGEIVFGNQSMEFTKAVSSRIADLAGRQDLGSHSMEFTKVVSSQRKEPIEENDFGNQSMEFTKAVSSRTEELGGRQDLGNQSMEFTKVVSSQRKEPIEENDFGNQSMEFTKAVSSRIADLAGRQDLGNNSMEFTEVASSQRKEPIGEKDFGNQSMEFTKAVSSRIGELAGRQDLGNHLMEFTKVVSSQRREPTGERNLGNQSMEFTKVVSSLRKEPTEKINFGNQSMEFTKAVSSQIKELAGNQSMEFTKAVSSRREEPTEKINFGNQSMEFTKAVSSHTKELAGNQSMEFTKAVSSRRNEPTEEVVFGNQSMEFTKAVSSRRNEPTEDVVFGNQSMEFTKAVSSRRNEPTEEVVFGNQSMEFTKAVSSRIKAPIVEADPGNRSMEFTKAISSRIEKQTEKFDFGNQSMEFTKVVSIQRKEPTGDSNLGNQSMEFTKVVSSQRKETGDIDLGNQSMEFTRALSRGREEPTGELNLEDQSMEFTKAISDRSKEPTVELDLGHRTMEFTKAVSNQHNLKNQENVFFQRSQDAELEFGIAVDRDFGIKDSKVKVEERSGEEIESRAVSSLNIGSWSDQVPEQQEKLSSRSNSSTNSMLNTSFGISKDENEGEQRFLEQRSQEDIEAGDKTEVSEAKTFQEHANTLRSHDIENIEAPSFFYEESKDLSDIDKSSRNIDEDQIEANEMDSSKMNVSAEMKEYSQEEIKEYSVVEDPFEVFCRRIKEDSEKKDCIYELRRLDKQMLAVEFVSNSFLLGMRFRNAEEDGKKEINYIKIISQLKPNQKSKEGKLLSLVHHILFSKINVDRLNEKYRSLDDVFPLLTYITSEVTEAMLFMFDLQNLSLLKKLDIDDAANRITFRSWSKALMTILIVTVSLKPFSEISADDIDVTRVIGNLDESEYAKDVKYLFGNVQRDYKFLRSFMEDVSKYIEFLDAAQKSAENGQ